MAEITPRVRPQEPTPQAVRTVTLADPRATQPSVQRYYLAPTSTTAKPGESEALDVLAHVLGRGSNSRLYQRLVVEKGIATSAGAGYSGIALDYSKFTLFGTPKPDVSLSELEQAMDAVIDEVIDKGVTADEVERSKNRLIADAVYANDNQATLARWYGAALTSGLTVAQVQTWPDRIRTVTAEAVRDAARRWLDKRRSVTGYLIKSPEEKRS